MKYFNQDEIIREMSFRALYIAAICPGSNRPEFDFLNDFSNFDIYTRRTH